MGNEPPSRLELLQGTPDLLILRALLAEPTHGHAIAKQIQLTSEELTRLGRKQLAAEQSKWETFSRAMGLILNPADQEGQ